MLGMGELVGVPGGFLVSSGGDQRCAGTSLVVQWLRLRTTNALPGHGPGLIPGRETRSHVLKLS